MTNENYGSCFGVIEIKNLPVNFNFVKLSFEVIVQLKRLVI